MTSDLQIYTLRIVLCAIGVSGGMKGNDLVAENVVARCNTGRNSDSPGVVCRDELIGSPDARLCRITGQPEATNLIEQECRFIDCGTFAVTISKVVDDWSMMARGPFGPL